MGDRAVDGLLAGVAAGLIMAVLLVAGSLLRGETLATLFGRFAPGETTSALSGFFAHMAVSAIYGLIFALLYGLLPWRWRQGVAALLVGLVYGLLLLAVALSILLPGVDSPLLELSRGILALGHAGYGLALGWLLQRMDS
jgi:hypothetical protein